LAATAEIKTGQSHLRFIHHTRLDTHTNSVGLLYMSDQPVSEVATYTTNTRNENPLTQWDSKPRSQQRRGCRPTS